jgi:hypothetical protein
VSHLECDNAAEIVRMHGMRGPLASVAVFALVCGWSVGARAQAPALNVRRGVDAQDCPDAARLAGDVAAIRGPAAAAATTAYTVDFTRDGQTFSAGIHTGPTGANVRLLEARGQTCNALAHAVAVTLALLFDSDKVESVDAKPSPAGTPEPAPTATSSPSPAPIPTLVTPDMKPTGPTSPASASATSPRSAPIATSSRSPPSPEAPAPEVGKRRREATVALGTTGLVGVLRPFSPGLSGELGLEIGRWRTALGGLAVFPQTLELGPGTVRESLLGGSMRACYAPWRGDRLRFDVCSGALIGAVKADGQGFTRNATQTQPWLAVPLEVAMAAFAGPLGLELGAGARASLQRPDFSVDGLGVAYRSPLVGATVSLRAIGQWPW